MMMRYEGENPEH